MRGLLESELKIVRDLNLRLSEKYNRLLALLRSHCDDWEICAIAISVYWPSQPIPELSDPIGEYFQENSIQNSISHWPLDSRLKISQVLISRYGPKISNVHIQEFIDSVVSAIDVLETELVRIANSSNSHFSNSEFGENLLLFEDEINFMANFPDKLWVSLGKNSHTFHKSLNCKGLDTPRAFEKVIQVNRLQAIRPPSGTQGRRPCEWCFPGVWDLPISRQ